MHIVSKESYRTHNKVNQSDNKYRIVLDMDINEWYKFLANNRINLENWKEFINKE